MTVVPKKLSVEFYFDVICPWCWIGLRQFVQARDRLQATHPGVELDVQWRSHLLLPHLPAQGVCYKEFYQRRFGNAEALAHRRAQIQAAGQGIVPPFEFDRIERMPNALAAHRLLAYAQQNGSPAQYEALLERLFCAYFKEGRDIGSRAVLMELGEQVLGACPMLDVWMSIQSARDDVRSNPAAAMINGVPALNMGSREPLSGVTSVDYLHSWLAQAA